MPTIPLFGFGKIPVATRQTQVTRKNCYVELSDDPDNAQIAIYKWPGMTWFTDMSTNFIQGVYQASDTLAYIVANGNLYSHQVTIVPTLITAITSNVDNDAFMAFNGTQLLINIRSVGTWIYNTSTSVLTNISSTLAAAGATSPKGCVFCDGFFVITQSGTQKFFISGLYNGLTWNGLDFASAETEPDLLTRVIATSGGLLMMGARTTELWRNIGAADFPFMRIDGGQSQYGLVANAFATVAQYNNTVFFVTQDRAGRAFVAMTDGVNVTDIMPPEMSNYINSGATDNGFLLDAYGLCYAAAGHVFYQLSLPNFNGGKSFVYDIKTQIWSQITDANGNMNTNKYTASLSGAGGALVTFIYPRNLGTIKYFDSAVNGDKGNPIPFEITSKQLWKNGTRMSLSSLEVFCENGIGLGTPSTLTLQISKDDGVTWGAPILLNMGTFGQSNVRAIVRRLGQARGFTFRLSNYSTDPIALFGCIVNEV